MPIKRQTYFHIKPDHSPKTHIFLLCAQHQLFHKQNIWKQLTSTSLQHTLIQDPIHTLLIS